MSLNELSYLFTVRVRADDRQICCHHLLKACVWSGEDEVPKRDHTEEPFRLVDHVDISDIGTEVVVERTERLNRLGCRHVGWQGREVGCHHAASGVCCVDEQRFHLAGSLGIEGIEDCCAVVRIEGIDEVCSLVCIHLRDQLCSF